jgi:hypothetical protein
MSTAELIPPADEPSPEGAKLALVPRPQVVEFDERRPWPLGLPTAREVLESIGAQAEVEPSLQAAHLRVLSLLPEHLYDAARTSLAGVAEPVALATASAWRAMVASDQMDAAIGVDQPALQALINEAVDAREKLLAAGYFALDGGESAVELMVALGEAIDRLVARAEFKAAPGPVAVPSATKLPSEASLGAEEQRRRLLRWAMVVTFIITSVFHLSRLLGREPTPAPWAVVGDVERGRAFVAPTGPDSDDASLQQFLAQLEDKGLCARQSASGEWVVEKIR